MRGLLCGDLDACNLMGKEKKSQLLVFMCWIGVERGSKCKNILSFWVRRGRELIKGQVGSF